MEQTLRTPVITRRDRSDHAHRKVCILFVSGFVADTYSEIEKQYVELCAKRTPDVEFVWLVPEMSYKHNRFARPANRTAMQEPVWVKHLQMNNIPYVVGNVSPYNILSNYLLFRRVFAKHDIDAVYTHFGYERFWATLFGKIFGKVTIWNEHWYSLGTKFVWSKKLFYRFFVDDFIAVSRFIAQTLPRNHRAHTVRNAIHTSAHGALPAQEKLMLRRRLGLPQDDKIVLLVSAFRENKRHDLAVDVCRRVLQERRDTFFVFLGEGVTRQDVQRKVEQLGIGSRVAIPGHVDNVDDYYMASDVCMLTSLGEPCALAVVESMKYALPLVAFDSGGTPEAITDGQTGVLVPEEDTESFSRRLMQMLEDEPLRRRLGESALQAVQKHANRDEWIQRLRTLLREIVCEQKRH